MTWTLRTPWLRLREGAWRRRAQRPGDLLYVAIGDSAAQGIGALDPDTGYVGLLAERLQRLSSRTVRVVNLSRYGAGVDDVLDRQLPALRTFIEEGSAPDLVTVAIGSNDMRDVDQAAFAKRFDAILAGLPPHSIVADLPCFHFGPREWDATLASHAIADRVRASGRPFAPLHRVTERRRGWGSFPEFSWDQFHPSRLGYRVWESAFAGAVNRRAKQLRVGDPSL